MTGAGGRRTTKSAGRARQSEESLTCVNGTIPRRSGNAARRTNPVDWVTATKGGNDHSLAGAAYGLIEMQARKSRLNACPEPRSAEELRRFQIAAAVTGRRDAHEYLRRRAAVARSSSAGREATWCQADRAKGVEEPATVERRAVHTSRSQGVAAGETAPNSESPSRFPKRRVWPSPFARGDLPGALLSPRSGGFSSMGARPAMLSRLLLLAYRVAAGAHQTGALA